MATLTFRKKHGAAPLIGPIRTETKWDGISFSEWTDSTYQQHQWCRLFRMIGVQDSAGNPASSSYRYCDRVKAMGFLCAVVVVVVDCWLLLYRAILLSQADWLCCVVLTVFEGCCCIFWGWEEEVGGMYLRWLSSKSGAVMVLDPFPSL